MAISFVAAGLTSNSTTTVAPGLPTGTAADDLMLYTLETRSTAAAPAAPAGWVKQADITVTVGAEAGGNGVDSGTAHMIVYTRVFVAGDTIPSLTVPAAGGRAEVFSYRRSAGSGWDLAFATGTDLTINTAHSAAATSDPGGTTGDWLFVVAGVNGNDIGITHTATAATWTGCTLGTIVQRDAGNTTSGNDLLTVIKDVPVNSGTSSGNPSMTWTWSGTPITNHPAAAAVYIRLREQVAVAAALPELVMAPPIGT